MLSPEYGENIIVGTVYKKKFNWYITQKNLWILDTTYEEECENEREHIPILNEETAKEFFHRVNKYKVDTHYLIKEFLKNLEKDEEETLYNFKPTLFVDFDQRLLYSMFQEYTSFEECVPEQWLGKYSAFYDIIEEEYKYWMVNEKNYFEGEGYGK